MYDDGPDPDDPEVLNRNWTELLQELRVTQTGVQLLSAFLLTVPFTDRFKLLDPTQRHAYVLCFSGSVLATAFLVAPAAFHRILFRRRQRRWIVEAAHICATVGLAILALTTSGIIFLVFDVVGPRPLALAALAAAVTVFGGLWLALPLASRARNGRARP